MRWKKIKNDGLDKAEAFSTDLR